MLLSLLLVASISSGGNGGKTGRESQNGSLGRDWPWDTSDMEVLSQLRLL